MNPATIDGVRALAPELALTLTAFCVLAADMIFGGHGSRRAGWVALAGLLATAALLVARSGLPAGTVFAMVEVDGFASFFQLLMTLGSLVVVLLWMFDRRERHAVPAQAYFLLLAALLGGFLMVETNHTLLLVLGFELLSLASYALAGLEKQRSASAEAALKFIVFSSFASALMIYGVSLLYGLSGTLDLVRMGAGDVASGAAGLAQQLAIDPLPVALALILVLAGFASKLSLAPLHFFTAEVVESSPSAVSAFFAVLPKAAGFGALLRFLSALFVQDDISTTMARYAGNVGLLLAILAAVTMTLGNLAALRQQGLKRLLAYSSIAHTGYAMIGVAALNETGFGAALVYIAVSALISAGVFAVLIHFEGIVGSDRLEDMRGLGWKTPLAGAGMVVLLAGWIGLPPTVGFYGKVRLFVEGWNAGLDWLVLVAAINTLVSACFVLRVVRILYSDSSTTMQQHRARVLVCVAVTLSISVLVLGLWTRPIDQWANSGLDLLRHSR